MRLLTDPNEIAAAIRDRRMPTLTWRNNGNGHWSGPYIGDGPLPTRHDFYPVAVASKKQLRKGLAATKI